MKRILSGIKPSGEVTLGNYLGAMKRWAELQEKEQAEHFYFVPNLHALTVRPDPKTLAVNSLSAVAWLLALGIDHKRATIFLQSQIPAHSELTWILDNFVTMGELGRMTQFKDKSQQASKAGQVVGLFNYPVLMAADILLYDADEVPVGEDQKQHVELTREIARRFNNQYGSLFKLPKPTIQEAGARIMNLQDPNRKMDKSDSDTAGVIYLTDSPGENAQKIKRAVTDSGKEIKAGQDKPALSNLLQIYSALSGKSVVQLEKQYQGKGYADFKSDLAGALLEVLKPLHQRYQELMGDRDQLIAIVEAGRDRALPIATVKLNQVKAKLGLF